MPAISYASSFTEDFMNNVKGDLFNNKNKEKEQKGKEQSSKDSDQGLLKSYQDSISSRNKEAPAAPVAPAWDAASSYNNTFKETSGDKDFKGYSFATPGGAMFDQGVKNLTDFANQHQDNEQIQGLYGGTMMDLSSTQAWMGLDNQSTAAQREQELEYQGGLDELKTGNTLKLLSAESGIVRDLMWDQGDIESRQIGERGEEDRKGLKTAGEEERKGIVTTGEQERLNIGTRGTEERLNIGARGTEERKGIVTTGEQERLNIGARGTQDRLNIGAQGVQDRMLTKTKGSEDRLGMREQGSQDRMLTQERGSEDRKTQRDKYREERLMRADARGAIRRTGSRFFG